MRVVVLGRQGAGKGTQCARLAAHVGAVHISTGDVFRAAIAADSALGRQVAAFVAAGELVDDDLTVVAVAETLSRKSVRASGFVLDGFPRTVRQAEQLDALIAPDELDLVIDLVVDRNTALGRLLRRRVCVECGANEIAAPNSHGAAICQTCGGMLARRADDTEPLIRRRLALYEQQTRPLLCRFSAQGILRSVDGHGPPRVVASRMAAAVLGTGTAPEAESRWMLSRMALESDRQ